MSSAIDKSYQETISPILKEVIQEVPQITQDLWNDKYRNKKPDGTPLEDTMADTNARVVSGVYSKDPRAEEFAPRALESINNLLWNPGGRIHAGAGTNKHVTLINCFSGDQEILTEEFGSISLKDVSGVIHTLGKTGWSEATVQCFGTQPIQRVVMKPAIIQNGSFRKLKSNVEFVCNVTPNHRWILANNAETTNLQLGDVLPSVGHCVDKRSRDFRLGMQHGLIFGDGSLLVRRENVIEQRYTIRLCGEKNQQYIRYFPEGKKYKFPSEKGDTTVALYSEEELKELPIDKSPNYIAGFIRGWLAADGSIDKRGCVILCSQNHVALDWVIKHAPYAGIVAVGDRISNQLETNLGVRKNPLRFINFRLYNHTYWKVTEIIPLEDEPVYCAVVPTEKAFTLSSGVYTGNCYVTDDIDDSMLGNDKRSGIMRSLEHAALTQQQGGGIGMPFQFLRPRGAIVRRTGSVSTGPIPFMRMWHSMCSTIMSSGARRGAMMATLTDNHADLYRPELHTQEGRDRTMKLLKEYMDGKIKIDAIPVDFITAKHIPNELTNFNVSALMSKKFMEDALPNNKMWDLGHIVEPADGKYIDKYPVNNGKDMFYVYNRVSAREIWNSIMRSTYDYAEPGVIFMDRVNELNNLYYCENINCTNPCGEQPLPKFGACNLGSVNYAMLVANPFTAHADVNIPLLMETAAIGQRFLDNVLDITNYPLEEQKQEAMLKRRTGNGVLGLGTLLQMMQIKYGSPKAVELTKTLLKAQRDAVYWASVNLAKERGTFPAYDKDKFLKAKFIQKIQKENPELYDAIAEYGVRNGVAMTMAPTGNTAIYYHNPSGSGEPDFEHEYTRKVKQQDGSHKTYIVESFGWRVYKRVMNIPKSTTLVQHGSLPEYMTTAMNLTVDDHLMMQAACQEFIDASISKTINIPVSYPFEDFKKVYEKAYRLGLKGVTTYRPSAVRGSVLEALTKKEEPKVVVQPTKVKDRPEALIGVTYKVLDGHNGSMFITVNADPVTKEVFEVFLRDNTGNEYVEHAGRALSLLLRAGVPVKEIRQQLRRSGGQLSIWYKGKGFTSQLQLLDYVVFEQAAKFFKSLDMPEEIDLDSYVPPAKTDEEVEVSSRPCPDCAGQLRLEAGCLKCTQCFYSKCG